MAKALIIREFGEPDVLRMEDVDVGAPGPAQLRVRHTAIGLNMSDTYRRRGIYKLDLPLIVGSEGCGIVEECGPEVDDIAPGDRIAYGGPLGSYAEERLVDAWRVVKVPDGITDQQAAAMMLKGLTVHYLLHWTYSVQPGDTVLIHAAAGGVGLIFCQWAKHIGATVIGTVGSDEKAAIAAAHGCDHPIVYTREDFDAKVMEITDGKGVHAAYDSIGKDTIVKSIECLRPRGVAAGFGQASGPFPLIDSALLQRGSKFLTRPGLAEHTATREMIETGASRLFDLVTSGNIKIEINQTYTLADAAQAHRDLEGRKTTGSTVLVPYPLPLPLARPLRRVGADVAFGRDRLGRETPCEMDQVVGHELRVAFGELVVLPGLDI